MQGPPENGSGRPPSYSGIFRVEATPVPQARPRRPRPRWLLATVLFLATCGSTTWIGGSVYAATVLFILLSHELGHYLMARHYDVPASLPYFLPMPSIMGTLGAVIVMRPRSAGRRVFFDIAAAGPVAGLLPTLLACVVGIRWSEVQPPSGSGSYFVELGDPLIFNWISRLTFGPLPDDVTLLLHPVAFAGWVGLLVTSLNLLPIGQLDGGHILYTLLGKRAHVVSVGLLGFAGLVVAVDGLREIYFDAGAGYWPWFLMVLLLTLLGARHPPTADDHQELGTGRKVLGWALLLFIIVGFTPRPFTF